MKFILALSIVALAAAGCGQRSGDQPQPNTPQSSSSNTKANLEAALANIPGQSPSDSAALINTLGTESEAPSPSSVADLQTQIGYQQNMLYAEQKALDEAVATRNNTVHLGPDFMDAAAYGIASGALGWNFLKRTNYLRGEGGSSIVSTEAAETAAATADRTVGATAAAAFREAAPIALKTTEAVSSVVLGVFFIGKTLQVGKDVDVRFSDTNAIRFHRAKVVEAEKNLENAKQNLAALYSPEKVATP